MTRCCAALFLLVLSSGASALPPFVVEWPDAMPHILVADASSSTLTRYSRFDGGVVMSSVYMSVGQRGIGKQKDGDRKTPLGVYFITEELDTFHLDPIYGAAAFPLDYPNARDRMLGLDGGGIWLHGVPPGGEQRPERDTDGCLAIGNDELLKLAESIQVQQTPVIIARSLERAEQSGELREELRANVDRWLNARRTGFTTRLADLYAEEFTKWGLEREAWLALWSGRDAADTQLKELFIARDPEEPALYVTRFRLGDDGESRYKRLYWERGTDDRFRIVAEDGW